VQLLFNVPPLTAFPHATVTNHCNSGGSGNLCAVEQSERSYFKVLEHQNWQIDFWLIIIVSPV
jgi:hypothetical protein